MIVYATQRYGIIVTSDNTLKHHYINSLCVIKLTDFFYSSKTFLSVFLFALLQTIRVDHQFSVLKEKVYKKKKLS